MKISAFFTISMLTFITVAAFSYQGTRALLTSQVTNTENSFQAAAVFPTASVSASPTATPTPQPTITPTPSPTPIANIANHIVISEVQLTGGTSHAGDDFIELYNPTNVAINLNGYDLIKKIASSGNESPIKSFTINNVIPAHGYFLWANSGFASISVTPDASTSATIANENSIALKNPQGIIIDALSWTSSVNNFSEGTAFSTPISANQSMERKAVNSSSVVSMFTGGLDALRGNGYDTDNNATDFIARTVSQPQNSSSPTEIP